MDRNFDITGSKFGFLTVVRFHSSSIRGRSYVCKCDCGKEIIGFRRRLITENKTSCSRKCPLSTESKKRTDSNRKAAEKRIGESYGRLTIIGLEHRKSQRSYRAICLCDCGKETSQHYADLKSGKVVSCGCYRTEQTSKTGSVYGLNNSGRLKNFKYKKDGRVITMRSSYEVVFARLLDSKGLDWVYEPKVFQLGKALRYVPDFYVPSTGEWFEVKGYVSPVARKKMEMFSLLGNKITLIDLPYLEKETGLKYKQMKKQWAFC